MRKTAFNNDWLFTRDGAAPLSVVLPHDAMIWEQRDKDAPSQGAGAYFPGGVYTYTKTFSMSAIPYDTCLLELEGAYRDCSVFLNNNFVTSNHLGSLGFFADLTPYLQADVNYLEVKVSNDTQQNCRWYSGSGLYRPAWLWTGGPVHIPPEHLRLSTPEVDQEVSQVKVELSIVNRLRQQTTVQALVILRDSQENVVCARTLPVTLFPGENPSLTWNLYLRNGKLWSPDTPNLYTCTVELRQGETLLDSILETFGLRHIQFDPVRGMRVNGRQIHLRGCCIHEDNGILGTADFANAVERKVRLIKKAGFNAIRIAHQPAFKNLLNVCDKLGILLLEESFDAWNRPKKVHDQGESFSEQWAQEVDRIVAKDFNHPCVFAYCIGNEILEVSQPSGIRYSRLLSQRFREKDPTRPVTNAINGIMSLGKSLRNVLLDLKLIAPDELTALGKSKKEGTPSLDINDTMTILQNSMDTIAAHPLVGQLLEESFSHLDLCGYNYMMGRYELDLTADPNRILFGSETTPPQIARLWERTLCSPGCLGDFTWTGWDYLGEAGIGCTAYDRKKDFGEPYPIYLAAVGDMDLTGYRLPISYYREIVFGLRKAPYLSVEDPGRFYQTAKCTPWAFPETVESWTWPGWEGAPVRVTVCAAGEEIVLLCNGEEVTRAVCGPETEYRVKLETVYHPGQLTAVSYSKGIETGRFTLRTAENTCELRAAADTTVLRSDGSDLCFLEIQLTDTHGVIHTDKDSPITLQTEGGVMVQGFGTADPASQENFFDATRMAYRGRALAALRGTSPGPARVVISCPDCNSITLDLEVIPS